MVPLQNVKAQFATFTATDLEVQDSFVIVFSSTFEIAFFVESISLLFELESLIKFLLD